MEELVGRTFGGKSENGNVDAGRPHGFQLTPLTRRRWANFRANKRGYWSLWMVGVMLFISLFAELIANDKPILLEYREQLYMPVFSAYPETEFGGILETEADFRDPVVGQLIITADGWMLWPLIPFSFDTIDRNTEEAVPEAPSGRHWLGTDDVGRDVVARLIYGFRLSMLFGLTLTILASIIGIAVGAAQGYFGGLTDLIGQRLVEIWTGLPTLFVIIILTSMFQPGAVSLLLILLAFSWMTLVSLVRAEFLRTRNFEYVTAARALGESDTVIMGRYILPNAMVATLTYLPFILSGSITTLTALDFLGFGLPAGYPSLGELLAQGKANLQAPWLGLAGFFTLAILLTLLVFVGEGVRDAFDSRRSVQ